jgi:hypothetical protein
MRAAFTVIDTFTRRTLTVDGGCWSGPFPALSAFERALVFGADWPVCQCGRWHTSSMNAVNASDAP